MNKNFEQHLSQGVYSKLYQKKKQKKKQDISEVKYGTLQGLPQPQSHQVFSTTFTSNKKSYDLKQRVKEEYQIILETESKMSFNFA